MPAKIHIEGPDYIMRNLLDYLAEKGCSPHVEGWTIAVYTPAPLDTPPVGAAPVVVVCPECERKYEEDAT